jgi:hypothetical protein
MVPLETNMLKLWKQYLTTNPDINLQLTEFTVKIAAKQAAYSWSRTCLKIADYFICQLEIDYKEQREILQCDNPMNPNIIKAKLDEKLLTQKHDKHKLLIARASKIVIGA